MKELLRIADALRASTEPAVLATLVKAEGSSYRRTGARLLLRESAHRLGSISGGCLEEDLAAHAASVLTTGESRTVVYDTTGENDLVWGAGLGCHGIVHVLLERVAGLPAALAFVEEAWARREAVVLVTAFRSQGETQPRGAVFATSESGRSWQDLSPLSESVAGVALTTLRTQLSNTLALDSLPGVPEVFIEFLPPPPALAVFGAGDDAQPLVRLAAELGWLVTVIDSRASYASRERFPSARSVVVAPPAGAVTAAKLDARSLAVVMTHRYLDDVPVLRNLLPQPLAYLGLLGPKKRAEKIMHDLAAEGLVITPEQRLRVHAPVGLDIGGSTPEEVALSILAEMQAVRSSRDGRPLRERTKPIHHE